MDTDTLIRIIVLICLLVLSAFFSSAETALTAVSPIRIRNLLDQNPSDKRAAAVMRIIDDPSPMLGTILVANNAVNLSASAITASLAYRFGGKHLALATGIITLLILVFGEITPKTIATIRTEKMALAYARPLIVLMTILTPIVFLINAISNGLLKLLGVSRDDAGKLTQGDIQTIVDVGHEEGIIQSDEKDIITNVFELKDSAVKEVMVPRVHVSILDADISFEELLKVFREDKYTRYPVYEDTPDRIIGTINMKDLLLYHDGDTSSFSVRNILREAHFVFEHKKIRELLAEMMEASVSIAIVVDEYGDWTGIITLEDVLEEIVGEIHDEYDEPSDDLIYQVAPNEYIAEGAISLDDFSDRLETEIESEDYDSLGGYILEQLDRIPDVGDAVTTESGIRLVVDSVDNNRIELVHVWLPEQVTEDTDHSS
ncbi:MAG: HlyC/CorC family transporter [Lachnospiraceae bacterium]|nr:HlyC/CorC family transporter [Lachnospiraceae bacterium]MBQ6353972.1 HlyC/CorC family transporter [Lachnospiraceae bacterium]